MPENKHENLNQEEKLEATKIVDENLDKDPNNDSKKPKEEIEPKKKNFWERKTLNEKIIFVISIILVIIFLILALAGKYIFKEGDGMYELSVENIGKFFDIGNFFKTKYPVIIETIAIIIFSWLIFKILHLIIYLLTIKGSRSLTVGRLLISVLKYTMVIVGFFLILSAWGVETPTLLASAGIIGLAISFGAQSLIEDVLAGLFIIFEKQFQIGDVVEIEKFRGKVIEIGIRVTKIEDIAGDIQIINNSDIRSAINTTASYSPVICDVLIGYGEDIRRVEKVIIDSLPRIKTNVPNIKEGPTYLGVNELGEHGISLRVYAKTDELDKYQARRDINRELKLIFDENDIDIPYNQIVVHQAEDEDALYTRRKKREQERTKKRDN